MRGFAFSETTTSNTMNTVLRFFDTTLRDGEQSPGCTMSLREKLLVAEQLEALRVDVVEAGFAAASPGDFEAVKAVAGVLKTPVVASLCRALEKDIDASWSALRGAALPRLHLFLATSPLHMEYKLRMEPDAVYERAVKMVAYARNLCPDVQFSLEDASRTEPDFMYRVIEGVIRAGATTVNIPDTVGYALPAEFAGRVRGIFDNVPNIAVAVIAVHCHNDLGMAVANSLAAVAAGARQVECTLTGIGERAGNAALEELAMALRVRHAAFAAAPRLDTTKLYNACRCVATVTGRRIPANKAIVGENAFAHESGIHQHGVLANPETYEIMTPASVGIPGNRMILGKHSGRHAFEERLKSFGFEFSGDDIQTLFNQFKQLADQKKTVSDADIEALAYDLLNSADVRIKLRHFNITSSDTVKPNCTLVLERDGVILPDSNAIGDGPVDAAFNAVNKSLGITPTLQTFHIAAVTSGNDALGEATLRVTDGTLTAPGRGLSTNILRACVDAYLAALNNLLARK